jgi:hypothetical protein
MKKLFISLIALSLTTVGFSQSQKSNAESSEVVLEGVTVSPSNLTYLTSVSEASMPQHVQELENKAAHFDIKESDIYDSDIDVYEVMFSQEDGTIIATYDQSGRILYSYERFKNVTLPFTLRNKIYRQYPGWVIHKDAYVVSYYRNGGVTKTCKVQLRKDGKRKNLKVDMDGNSI